jgi:hypothetical protein
MKIELTQDEVKAAVAGYVETAMGIDLTNKDLDIVFSATRYEGTIAKLTITPKVLSAAAAAVANKLATIPGYSDGTVDVTAVDAPALAELVADPADVATEAQADATLNDPVQEAATLVEVEVTAEPAEVVEDTAPAAETTAPVKKSTATLFGKPASAA